jgi:hypothetical protein
VVERLRLYFTARRELSYALAAVAVLSALALIGLLTQRDSDKPTADSSSTSTTNESPGVPGENGTTTPPPGGDPSSTTSTTESTTPAQPVDLANPPGAGDASAVARWWAATWVAYSPSDAPKALAIRLAPRTAPDYVDTLAGLPPAASYGDPTPIIGATASPARTTGTGTHVTVDVATPAASTVLDITLAKTPAGWQVTAAQQL